MTTETTEAPTTQLIGKPMDMLAPEVRREQFMNDLRAYITTGEVPATWRGAQASARHASGRLIPIEVSSSSDSASHRSSSGSAARSSLVRAQCHASASSGRW